MTNRTDLPVPDRVLSAARAAEMLRVWVADGDQVVTLSPAMWADPGAWGLLLADLAKHVAAAYEAKGIDRDAALRSIRAAMDAEWSHPTDAA